MKRLRIHSECKIEEDDILEIFYNISVFDPGLYGILKHKDKFTYNNDRLIIDWITNLSDKEYEEYKDKLDRLVDTEDVLYYQTMHSDVTTTYSVEEIL